MSDTSEARLETDLVELMTLAIERLLANPPEYEAAASALASIDEKALLGRAKTRADGVRHVPRDASSRERIELSRAETDELFESHTWTCQYCGCRTVSSAVCKELQRIGVWKYFSSGPPKWWHAIAYTHLATPDHVVPRLHESSNIVTACWSCQAAKNSRPLTSLIPLGWSLQERRTEGWRGLSEFLPRLKTVGTWRRS